MQRKAIAILIFQFLKIGTFPGGTVVKNLPAKAGDTRDACSIPGSGRSLEWEMATHSIILAWKIPWTKEPGGLQSMGSQSQTQPSTHVYYNVFPKNRTSPEKQ